MSRPLTSGIYRERQDVCGPNGLARVERDRQYPRGRAEERYTVRFYAREAPKGHLVSAFLEGYFVAYRFHSVLSFTPFIPTEAR